MNVPFREVCNRAKLFDTGRALGYSLHALRLVKENEGRCDSPVVIHMATFQIQLKLYQTVL